MGDHRYLRLSFCRGRIFESLEDDKGQHDKIKDIFWASGAALFAKVYLKLGGLDEGFLLTRRN